MYYRFFLNRFFIFAKIWYWSIELKMTDFVWILRKIRHLIDFSKQIIIVYIDHEATLNIVKQTTLFTSFTDKLNLRFVRAFDYIQRFDFVIKHKSNKFHIVFDVLSRFSLYITKQIKNELNVFYCFFSRNELHVQKSR